MNTRILITAIASLALFAGTPAFALASATGAINGPHVENATPGIVLASVSKGKAHCRGYYNYHARSRCRQIHGIPDHEN
ncbi:hypothetical protein SAMN05444161_8316 [Rhizobiales bacterium GAS191]|nr:hypothetical protein SAMN05444161_8316 [Rhizobiales bacterium GAS191]